MKNLAVHLPSIHIHNVMFCIKQILYECYNCQVLFKRIRTKENKNKEYENKYMDLLVVFSLLTSRAQLQRKRTSQYSYKKSIQSIQSYATALYKCNLSQSKHQRHSTLNAFDKKKKKNL